MNPVATSVEDRRVDVDWLRVLATYLLFVFHGAMVFNPAPFFHVRNQDLSFGLLVLCGFISLWHMPLFFVLAGWSMASSLGTRGVGGFARERVSRLLVPLIAGCALLGPPIKFFELRSGLDLNHLRLAVSPTLQDGFRQVIPGGLPVAPPFEASFLELLPEFFTRLDRFTWAHLWFVAYLLTFSMLYLPALAWTLHRPRRTRRLGAVAVYLPIVPLVAIQVWLRPLWPGIYNLYADWANFAWYSTFLLLGFLLARHPAFEEAVHREWQRALLVALVAMVALLALTLGIATAPRIVLAGSAIAAWCFVVSLLGLARRFLTRSSPLLAYLSESAFPVYVLHQAAIVVIGFAVVRLPLGIAPKLVLLIGASLSATMLVYHFFIRPYAGPRLLLGMKPRTQGRPVATAQLRPGTAVGSTLLLLLLGPATAAGAVATPVGLWHAEGGAAQVEISPCGERLCGRIVWLRSPLDERGCELHDSHNPEPELRGRGLVGLQILLGLTPVDGEPERWEGGSIYDPTSGRTYRCAAMLEDEDRLLLRGYLGIPLIGRTTSWIRVGSEDRICAGGGPGPGA